MTEIDTYLSHIPEPQRGALEHVRELFQQTAPDAEEVISYGMPGFKYKGKYLGGVNMFKNHLSFFPTNEPVATYQEQLQGFTLSTGTVQFTPDHPIPDELVVAMIRCRMDAINK